MKFRIALDILLLAAVIHGWWFICIPIALIGALRFGLYFEMLIAGLAYDSLFGLIREQGVYSYMGIIVSIAVFLAMMLLKKVMRK